jgi:hypothetical protein
MELSESGSGWSWRLFRHMFARVRVSGGPLLPPETAEVGGSPGLAEIPDLRCHVRGTSPRGDRRSQGCASARRRRPSAQGVNASPPSGRQVGRPTHRTCSRSVRRRTWWGELVPRKGRIESTGSPLPPGSARLAVANGSLSPKLSSWAHGRGTTPQARHPATRCRTPTASVGGCPVCAGSSTASQTDHPQRPAGPSRRDPQPQRRKIGVERLVRYFSPKRSRSRRVRGGRFTV